MKTQPTVTAREGSLPGREDSSSPEWLQLAKRYVGELTYGQVTITVHQGMVTEIQKMERTRLGPPQAH